MVRLIAILFAAALAALSQERQKPLDLVLVLEPVDLPGGGGRLSRSAEDLKLQPDDRLAVVELIGGPKVKAKLGEGKTKVGMRWRPTFRLGAEAQADLTGRKIYDALILATQQLPDDYDPNRQRAILLVTDNEELGSKAMLRDVLAAIQASQCKLSILATPPPKGQKAPPKRGVSIEPLAAKPGDFRWLEGADPLNAAIERLRLAQ